MGLGLILRLAYLAEQQNTSVLFYQLFLDEQEMAVAAKRLLAGEGLGKEPLFKAPLYPFYLAGMMAVAGERWLWLARAVQHLLGAFLILIAYDTARRMTSSPKAKSGRLAGMLAAVIVAGYGPLIRLEHTLVLDFLTVFLQSAMLWAMVRSKTSAHPKNGWKWVLLAGICAMLAWLNRPTILLTLPFLVVWVLGWNWRGWRVQFNRVSSRRRLVWAMLFSVFPLLAMGGVYWRNHAVGGEGMVLPWQGGYNFYHANKQGANGRYLLQETFSLTQRGNPTRELAEAGYEEAVRDGTVPPAETGRFRAINAYWFNRAIGEIKADPSAWAALMGRKLLYLASAREIFNFEDYDVQKRLSGILRWLPLNFGHVWPLALASVALVAMLPRGRRQLAGLMWGYLFFLGGAVALYFTSGRLRMPLAFPAIVLAASGVAVAVTRLRANRTLCRAAVALALLILGAWMSWGDWWGVRSENLRHIEFARLSNAAWHSGQPDKALNYADASRAEKPDYPTLSLLRGQALYGLGKTNEAVLAFSESMTRLPTDPVAPYNLGIIHYYQLHQPAKAAGFFEEAIRRQPQYHSAYWMSCLAHLRLGQTVAAARRLSSYLPVDPARSPQTLCIADVALNLARNEKTKADQLIAQLRQAGREEVIRELVIELELLGMTTDF